MTVQEKLDDLDGRLQQLSHIINESAGRGNREFTDIDRRLSVIEEMLKTLGTAAVALLGKSVGAAESP
jgi:hypothetical protein